MRSSHHAKKLWERSGVRAAWEKQTIQPVTIKAMSVVAGRQNLTDRLPLSLWLRSVISGYLETGAVVYLLGYWNALKIIKANRFSWLVYFCTALLEPSGTGEKFRGHISVKDVSVIGVLNHFFFFLNQMKHCSSRSVDLPILQWHLSCLKTQTKLISGKPSWLEDGQPH